MNIDAIRAKIASIDDVILAINDYEGLVEESITDRNNLLQLINTHKPITTPLYTLEDIRRHTLDGLRAEFQDYRNLLSTRLAAAIGPAATAEAGYAASGPVAASRYAASGPVSASRYAASRYAAASGPVSAVTTATVSDYMPVTTVVVIGHGGVDTFNPPLLFATSTNTGVRRYIKTGQLPFNEYYTGLCVLDSVVLATAVVGGVIGVYEGVVISRIFQEIANYENTNGKSLTGKLKELFPPLKVTSEAIATPAVDGGLEASKMYQGLPLFVCVEGKTLGESLSLIDNVYDTERGDYKGAKLSEVFSTGIFPEQVSTATVAGVTYVKAFNIGVYTPLRVMTGSELDNSFNPYTLQWRLSGPNMLDNPYSTQCIGARYGTQFPYTGSYTFGELNGPPVGDPLYMPAGQTLGDHTRRVMNTCVANGITGRVRILFIGCGAYSGGSDNPITPLESKIMYRNAFKVFTRSNRLNITTYAERYYYLLFELLVKEIESRITAGGKRKRRRINGRRITRKRVANKRTRTRRRR